MNDTMRAYVQWSDIGDVERSQDFQAYVHNIAEARNVTRRVMRIVDDQAKNHGLSPLPHQALLQIYGSNQGEGCTVSGLAGLLDIAAALASRIVRQLEELKFVRREHSTVDRRSTNVIATAAGIEKLSSVDADVHYHVAYLQHQLLPNQRFSALSIYAFYVGLDPSSTIAKAIRSAASS